MYNMFHSAALKLTVWYLGIIMVISIAFSTAIYHVSSSSLDRNARRQVGFFNNFLSPSDVTNFSNLRRSQVEEDEGNLKTNLILLNGIVLIGGGFASYKLARRTLRPIEDSHEAQKRFASDASHELRTPLAAMQSEIEVALRNKGLSKADSRQILESNLEEVVKLKLLSESLLKLGAGPDNNNFRSRVSLGKVIESATARLKNKASKKQIDLVANAQDINVHGDEQGLVDLVAILVDNAVKYSPVGSKITVSAKQSAKYAQIIVHDQGEGIASQDLSRIFERFYRVDDSRAKSVAEGYGLGLSIAKRIVESHNGHIEVKSKLKKGSQFIVNLPKDD